MSQMLKDNRNTLQEALRFHQTGNFTEASIIYNRILEKEPDNVDANSLLGTLNLQTGNFDVACIFLQHALVLKPDNAIAHNNLGSAFQASGRLEEAIGKYNQAIALKLDYDEAYYNLGNALQAIGRYDEAIANYKRAIIHKPEDSDTHSNLGNALRKSGKPDEALISYEKAIMLKPHNAELHCNLGAALQGLDRLDDAIISYKQAIVLKPALAMAHNNLGTLLEKQHKLDESIESYNRAIRHKYDYAEAYKNLGSALHGSGRYAEAITSHEKAILLKPDYPEAYYNLGNTLNELDKLSEALTSYRQSIKLKPHYAEAHNNLGYALLENGMVNDAASCFSRAIEIEPDYADAHLNRSLTLLLTENFKEGWQEYEWRLLIKELSTGTDLQPTWDGKPLNGKSILIHTEQGFGDIIQFVRYLPMVKSQGGHVTLECEQSLHRLLKNCDGIDGIIEKVSIRKPISGIDFHILLLSLPRIFDTTLGSIPSDTHYIPVDPVLKEHWRIRLEDNKNIKVGIVWAGNRRHKNDHNRSCSLADFSKLSGIPEISLYSLQKGPASIENNNSAEGMNIINLENDLHDFADTAAAIANLDIVISVDTAVAHLTGAIGKPVWTLLPFAPDWRWLLKRTDSPWYPTMRLFRQTQRNDWDDVLGQVKIALIKSTETCISTHIEQSEKTYQKNYH